MYSITTCHFSFCHFGFFNFCGKHPILHLTTQRCLLAHRPPLYWHSRNEILICIFFSKELYISGWECQRQKLVSSLEAKFPFQNHFQITLINFNQCGFHQFTDRQYYSLLNVTIRNQGIYVLCRLPSKIIYVCT